MATSLIPETYEQWKHCITEICKEALTPDFIAARIAALNDSHDHMTQKFVTLYGDAQRVKTLEWLEQAKTQLA